jgi:hypothetical protein
MMTKPEIPPMVNEPNQAEIDKQSAQILREAAAERNKEKSK